MSMITTYAPGRAELLGNHTDYNEGYVLAVAVDRGITLTGTVRADRMLELNSRDLGRRERISSGPSGRREGLQLVPLRARRGGPVPAQ